MKKFTIALTLIALMMIAGNTNVNAQRVLVTVAGTGVAGFSGDLGAAKYAKINAPHDVCMDAAQNIYFIDMGNSRIRKVSARTGVVTTYAGGGASSADGIAATAASLTPDYMCIDAAGNIFVTDGNKIRKIAAATGIITTVAGTGIGSFSGDGGPAVSADLSAPRGVCVDAAGNLYFADAGNSRIRKVTAATGIISTIGGSGASGYSGDGGPALAAAISDPYAIGVNATGDVYFSDQSGNYIRKISAPGMGLGGGIMTHIAGIPGGYVAAASGGPAATTAIGQIYGIHVTESGDLYCDDGSCSCVHIEMSSGNIYLEAGSLSIDGYGGDNLNALLELFCLPGGLWVDATGNIYVADDMNNRVRKAIKLTHQPTFVYGKGIVLNPCGATPLTLDSMLHITDYDSAQTETFTVVSAPVHGTLAGFPAAVSSMGTYSVTEPGGLSYTLTGGYAGLDSFRIRVNDGFLSDTMTIYISAGAGAITGPDNICTAPAATYLPDPSDPAFQNGIWSLSSSVIAEMTGFGIVTGLSAGSVDLSYTITNTCGSVSTVKTIMVDVALPATAGTISGPAAVCAGANVTLTDATTGGVWSVSNPGASVTGAGVVTGSVAGSDTVIYTVTNGCGSVTTATEIAIKPLPDAGAIVGDATVCIGATTTLTDAAAGGVWSAGNSHSTVSAAGLVTGVSAGTVSIAYTVNNSCGTATATQEIVVTNCDVTGVGQNVAATPAVQVFPNPASAAVNVTATALQQGNAGITVTDVTGREVLRTTLIINGTGNGEKLVDLSGLREGVYFMAISAGINKFTDKLVVNK